MRQTKVCPTGLFVYRNQSETKIMYIDGKDPLELLAWDVKCLIDTARDACEFNENTNILTVLEYASKL